MIPPGTNVVGLITTRLPRDQWVKSLMKSGCKVVRIGYFPRRKDDERIPAVLPDMTEAGRLAADHFADRQFKDVGYIGNFPWATPPYFYKAFKKQALKRGCKCHLLQVGQPEKKKKINGAKIFENRMQHILEWLEKVPKPIGLFTYNDNHAAEIYTIVRFGGFEVPEDIALLGLGNDHVICDSLPVPLSSIDMNMEQQGITAVKLLNHLILGGGKPEKPVIIPPKAVVVRQSTNLLAVPDPVTGRALRFIWDHFTEQLSIDDVAHAAAVSRRKLTRKFNQFIGHGVNAEIRRKRIEKACELLRENKLNISEIAISTGFPSPSFFYTTFKKIHGTTPRNYRTLNSQS